MSMDKPDYLIKELNSDDQILMATDGFYKFIDNSSIEYILKSNLTVKEKCNSLLENVINKSDDNITITLIKI
ncbi:MAG: hypothetical protein E7E74_04385 [Finegoldia magna]|nr:hypothetical protein [Finegoldia magna]